MVKWCECCEDPPSPDPSHPSHAWTTDPSLQLIYLQECGTEEVEQATVAHAWPPVCRSG